MRVLMVADNTESINMPVLPLGMACVARAAEDAGHEVATLNLMSAEDLQQSLVPLLASFRPHVIGLSIRNIDDQASQGTRFFLEPVKAIVDLCRRFSNARIVLGGAGYSIFPTQVLAYLGVDKGIQGEGEASFVMLLERLARHDNLSDIPGLHCASRAISNPPAVEGHIDRFRLPDPDPRFFFPGSPAQGSIWMPFQTRRGCPLDCIYCSTAAIEGRRIRKRGIDEVVASLEKFVAAGYDHFYFVDNTFNLPTGYAQRLCEAIVASGLNIRWRCILYPWKVDKSLVQAMAAAGCAEVSLGFESGSDTLLEQMNKRFRTADVRRIADLLGEARIRRMGFLLLGLPGDTQATIRQSLEFADSLNLEMVKVTIGARIYPNTALASYAVRTGYLSAADALLLPKFYIEPHMAAWLRETVASWIKSRSNWVC